MNITEFKMKKSNWWKDLFSLFYDMQRISMRVDGHLVTISWNGWVEFWDGYDKNIVHWTNCSNEFIDELKNEIKKIS